MCWLHPGGRFCREMQRGGEPAVSIDCQRARINWEGGYRSAPIAAYRPQTELFGGRSDGKFVVRLGKRRELSGAYKCRRQLSGSEGASRLILPRFAVSP
jgi:hypothetical protein